MFAIILNKQIFTGQQKPRLIHLVTAMFVPRVILSEEFFFFFNNFSSDGLFVFGRIPSYTFATPRLLPKSLSILTPPQLPASLSPSLPPSLPAALPPSLPGTSVRRTLSFPGFIAAMVELVKALNKHATTPNWNQTVATKLDKMVVAVSVGGGTATGGRGRPALT